MEEVYKWVDFPKTDFEEQIKGVVSEDFECVVEEFEEQDLECSEDELQKAMNRTADLGLYINFVDGNDAKVKGLSQDLNLAFHKNGK